MPFLAARGRKSDDAARTAYARTRATTTPRCRLHQWQVSFVCLAVWCSTPRGVLQGGRATQMSALKKTAPHTGRFSRVLRGGQRCCAHIHQLFFRFFRKKHLTVFPYIYFIQHFRIRSQVAPKSLPSRSQVGSQVVPKSGGGEFFSSNVIPSKSNGTDFVGGK